MKTHRSAGSSGTIPTCENPGVTRLGIEPVLFLPSVEPQDNHNMWLNRMVATRVRDHTKRIWLLRMTTAHKTASYWWLVGVTHAFERHVGIVPDDAAGRLFFSGISRFPRPYIPALLHPHFALPSSALNTLMLRATQISSLHYRPTNESLPGNHNEIAFLFFFPVTGDVRFTDKGRGGLVVKLLAFQLVELASIPGGAITGFSHGESRQRMPLRGIEKESTGPPSRLHRAHDGTNRNWEGSLQSLSHRTLRNHTGTRQTTDDDQVTQDINALGMTIWVSSPISLKAKSLQQKRHRYATESPVDDTRAVPDGSAVVTSEGEES
ncbi:hypothetical protein PR048_017778 [Dryococelus australis]|uniref:Uncharacterized protein n=1 Tax=Dryococelus australis TaxID=614101 RepID=A0ABQ9HAF9_9NEOP|nr:hypothetical protein PR048_017778 [Dryococelus australis]